VNTAIFELVHAVRLRTLPVERPDELAFIKGRGREEVRLVGGICGSLIPFERRLEAQVAQTTGKRYAVDRG